MLHSIYAAHPDCHPSDLHTTREGMPETPWPCVLASAVLYEHAHLLSVFIMLQVRKLSEHRVDFKAAAMAIS